MRSAAFVKVLLLALSAGLAAPADAVRAAASATIVAYVNVAALPSTLPVAVSISTVRAVPYAYVTVAFN
ncbi:MAG: hypothetical protein ABI330_02160 [Caldimonas sp.]|nr:hypothetical protein [Pseudomonadota bacterium]